VEANKRGSDFLWQHIHLQLPLLAFPLLILLVGVGGHDVPGIDHFFDFLLET
jgi:hypothetical protein